jgi:uncharacterized protein YndB with AHSA1/START domain
MTNPIALVERLLPAPCDVVYDDWLSVESLIEWMCPHPARLSEVELEPVVGGRFRFDIEDGGQRMVVFGQYLTLDRPHNIRFTWSCSTWLDPDHVSIVTVLLRPTADAQTHMTIAHELLPPGTDARHMSGWEQIAEQLAGCLATPRPTR